MSVPKSPLSLAQKLEASHLILLDCIDSFKSVGRDFTLLKPKLVIFTECLLRHMQLHNEELFLVLEENYQRQNPSSQMPLFFKVQLKELKVRLYTFMEMYLEKTWSSKQPGFQRDFKEFTQAVLELIEEERSYMLPYCLKH